MLSTPIQFQIWLLTLFTYLKISELSRQKISMRKNTINILQWMSLRLHNYSSGQTPTNSPQFAHISQTLLPVWALIVIAELGRCKDYLFRKLHEYCDECIPWIIWSYDSQSASFLRDRPLISLLVFNCVIWVCARYQEPHYCGKNLLKKWIRCWGLQSTVIELPHIFTAASMSMILWE